MLFRNNTNEQKKARVKEKFAYRWVSVRPGETIDLPQHYGQALCLDLTTQDEPISSEGETVKEYMQEKKEETGNAEAADTRQEKDSVFQGNYKKNLTSIKGIGKKTAEDIISLYPTEPELVNAIEQGNHLPLQDDVAKKLKEHYK